MGRIRSLKPEFGHSEKLSAEHSEVHLLAALLLTYADDEGYFNANPKLVQAACCPLRELFMSIPEILVRLTAVGYIEMLPGAQGRTYARVINFFTHQRVAHPTASKIKLLVSPPENFVKPPDIFTPDLGTGNREQGSRNREEIQDIDGQVHEIAALYPKILDPFHLTRQVAESIARAIIRDGRDVVWVGTQSMSQAVAHWAQNEKQFIPSAPRFFDESQYRKSPEEWERNGNGKPVSKAELVVEQALANCAAAKRAIRLDH